MKRRWKITLWVVGVWGAMSVVGAFLPDVKQPSASSDTSTAVTASTSAPGSASEPSRATSEPAASEAKESSRGAPETASDATSDAISIGQKYRTNNSALMGCRTIDEFDKLLGYLNEGDKDAFKQALAQAALAGECELFGTGEVVYVSDIKIFRQMAQVHRQGQPAKYWVTNESLSPL